MAQAEPEPGDGEDDVETCRVAMEAALEKGLNFCDSSEARVEVLGKIVGLDGSDTDFDVDEVLSEGPKGASHPIQTRRWVLARADRIIDTEGEEPLDSINRAWNEVATKAPDDEPEEEAVEDDDEEPL